MKNTKHEILLGLTTTPGSDWRGKVAEMKKYNIKRIALFPTFLKIADRKKLYELLEDIEGLVVPHVHLREEDTEPWELTWFIAHGAEVFNIHMENHGNEFLNDYADKIYIENHTHKSIPVERLEQSAGICLDFQHWKIAQRIKPSVAEKTKIYAEKYSIGCCHVSPLPKCKNSLIRLWKKLGNHYMISIDEMDYLQEFKVYLPKFISLEMENSFEEQLRVKSYLKKLLQL
jgi:hypothetical protein